MINIAKLHVIFACMGVGKSEDLIREYNSYKLNKMNVLALKSRIDTREGINECYISSRNGNKIPAQWIDTDENIFTKVMEYIDTEGNIKAIIIDECNFLSEEQINQISDIVDILNIDCYCYSLLTNFKGYLFEGSKRLIELVDHDCIRFMITRDSEGNIPNVNAKIFNNRIVKNGDEIEVGDTQYKPITRKNWKLGIIK
ncbi:TPA: thymidine kinase [Clostridium botulinum]